MLKSTPMFFQASARQTKCSLSSSRLLNTPWTSCKGIARTARLLLKNSWSTTVMYLLRLKTINTSAWLSIMFGILMAVKTLTKTMIRMASNASNKDHRLLSRTTFWRSRDQCSALAKPAHWILLQRRNSITNPRSAPPAATQQTLQCMQDLLNRVKSSKSSNKMCVDRLTLATISLTMFQFKVPQGSPNTSSY